MNKCFYSICALMFACNAYALKSFTANYNLSLDGIFVATETRTLNTEDDRYIYFSKAQTTGLAKLFSDITIEAKSTFFINDYGVDSRSYFITENKDGALTKSTSLIISSENNEVVSNPTIFQEDTVTIKSKGGNIIDPLSLFLALAYDLEKYPGKSTFSYQLADGTTIKDNVYSKIPGKTIAVGNKLIEVIGVTILNSENDIMALFSPEYQFLPVIIERTNGDTRYRYELISLEVISHKSETLKVVF